MMQALYKSYKSLQDSQL